MDKSKIVPITKYKRERKDYNKRKHREWLFNQMNKKPKTEKQNEA